jgi:hypothetical protein
VCAQYLVVDDPCRPVDVQPDEGVDEVDEHRRRAATPGWRICIREGVLDAARHNAPSRRYSTGGGSMGLPSADCAGRPRNKEVRVAGDHGVPRRDRCNRRRSGSGRIHTGAPRTPPELLAHADSRTSVYFCGPPGLLPTSEASSTGSDRPDCMSRDSPPNRSSVDSRSRFASPTPRRPSRSRRTDRPAPPCERRCPTCRTPCQQGFCGTGSARVLAGDVDRRGRSAFLDEPDTMLLCTDRAESASPTIEL